MNEDSIRLAAKAAYFCCLLDEDLDPEVFNSNVLDVLESVCIEYSDEDVDAIIRYAESDLF